MTTPGASSLVALAAKLGLRGKLIGGGVLALLLLVGLIVYEWRCHAAAKAEAAVRRAERERENAGEPVARAAAAARVAAAEDRAVAAWRTAQAAKAAREELRRRLAETTGVSSRDQVVRRADKLGAW